MEEQNTLVTLIDEQGKVALGTVVLDKVAKALNIKLEK